MTVAQTLVTAALIILAIGGPIVLFRSLGSLFRGNREGDGGGGGVAGMFGELDRLVRPSIQHVEEVREHASTDDESGPPAEVD